ncbi:MAG: Smr/MutS family protein [Bacilli bacterium]|nr:Smr/MutS family protein [Bacilli bacterium]
MNPFLNILPQIDVHGYTADLVVYPISDFINDNIKLKNYKIVIVHGIGKSILKNTIRNHFSRDKRIKKLYGDSFNLGVTIIELNK